MSDDKPNTSENVARLPAPEQFRAWLKAALSATKLSASRVSRDLDLSQNAIGGFLAESGRDIRLGNAARIEAHLLDVAKRQEIELAPSGLAA